MLVNTHGQGHHVDSVWRACIQSIERLDQTAGRESIRAPLRAFDNQCFSRISKSNLMGHRSTFQMHSAKPTKY